MRPGKISESPFPFGRKENLTLVSEAVKGGAVQMMQSDNQVPYPLIQIQGALAVQKKGE